MTLSAPINIFAAVLGKVQGALDELIASGDLPPTIERSRVLVEPPRDPAMGEMATNAAMVLAKEAQKKPADIAGLLATRLRLDPLFTEVEIAGAGFINLRLDPEAWLRELRAALALGPSYGRSHGGQGQPVNVEYVSANPTGPMHVGHCRGAVFGDALANLLAFAGYDVTREYYINDAGAQVDVLARSAFLRYREALGEDVGAIPEGLYPGDYLVPVGHTLAAEFGTSLRDQSEPGWLPVVRGKTIDLMMDEIRKDLAALKVRHDIFFSERSLSVGEPNAIARTIDELTARGLIYQGRLPPPKGKPAEDWEDREQTLFRASQFGDEVDRPLMKSDGSYTYFAADIAYHRSKFERGFRHLIDVWGADHGGYIKRVRAAVSAITGGAAELDVKIVQLVRLFRGGELVRMSKRSGEFVTLREVVDEVGSDAVRFMMLYRKNDAVLDFDLAKVVEQSRDNPVFYVQYGHARGRSIFRNAREGLPQLPADDAEMAVLLAEAHVERLTDESERSLIRLLGQYPRIIEAAAQAHEPHRIAFYLYEVASAFHTHWTKGRDAPHLRFIIQDDPIITIARLALVQGVVTVLSSGLNLLGVEAPEEMR